MTNSQPATKRELFPFLVRTAPVTKFPTHIPGTVWSCCAQIQKSAHLETAARSTSNLSVRTACATKKSQNKVASSSARPTPHTACTSVCKSHCSTSREPVASPSHPLLRHVWLDMPSTHSAHRNTAPTWLAFSRSPKIASTKRLWPRRWLQSLPFLLPKWALHVLFFRVTSAKKVRVIQDMPHEDVIFVATVFGSQTASAATSKFLVFPDISMAAMPRSFARCRGPPATMSNRILVQCTHIKWKPVQDFVNLQPFTSAALSLCAPLMSPVCAPIHYLQMVLLHELLRLGHRIQIPAPRRKLCIPRPVVMVRRHRLLVTSLHIHSDSTFALGIATVSTRTPSQLVFTSQAQQLLTEPPEPPRINAIFRRTAICPPSHFRLERPANN